MRRASRSRWTAASRWPRRCAGRSAWRPDRGPRAGRRRSTKRAIPANRRGGRWRWARALAGRLNERARRARAAGSARFARVGGPHPRAPLGTGCARRCLSPRRRSSPAPVGRARHAAARPARRFPGDRHRARAGHRRTAPRRHRRTAGRRAALVGVPRIAASLLAIPGIAAYAWLSGGHLPSQRAAVMVVGSALLARACGARIVSWNALALAAIVRSR